MFRESRSSHDNPRADWYVWADPHPDGSPPNNWLSVFGGSGLGMGQPGGGSITCTISCPRSRTSTTTTPQVQDWALSVLRFWLDRGVDGFRLDTVNYYFHDAKLRNNGPLAYTGNQPPGEPL